MKKLIVTYSWRGEEEEFEVNDFEIIENNNKELLLIMYQGTKIIGFKLKNLQSVKEENVTYYPVWWRSRSEDHNS